VIGETAARNTAVTETVAELSAPPARRSFLSEYGLSGTLIVGLILAWQAGVNVTGVPKWLLPSPFDVANTILNDRDLISMHVGRTIQEAAIGFGLAAVLGISLGFAMDAWPLARRVLYPPLIGSQTVPIIAIAPLLVIWFGYDIVPKVMVVALICFDRRTRRRGPGLRQPGTRHGWERARSSLASPSPRCPAIHIFRCPNRGDVQRYRGDCR
jgi:hypothetical protein